MSPQRLPERRLGVSRPGRSRGTSGRRGQQGDGQWGPWICRGQQVTEPVPSRVSASQRPVPDRRRTRRSAAARRQASYRAPAGRSGASWTNIAQWVVHRDLADGSASSHGERGPASPAAIAGPSQGRRGESARPSDEETEAEWVEASPGGGKGPGAGASPGVHGDGEAMGGTGDKASNRRKRLWKEGGSGAAGNAACEGDGDEEVEFAWSTEKAPAPRQGDARERSPEGRKESRQAEEEWRRWTAGGCSEGEGASDGGGNSPLDSSVMSSAFTARLLERFRFDGSS